MGYRFPKPLQAALIAGSVACLVSPFLFWVGRGKCGWACYSPVGADQIAGPSRLEDLHIGWHVALLPSCALILLGLAVLTGLLLQRKSGIGGRARMIALVAAAGVAVWALATAFLRGNSSIVNGFAFEPGLEKGGFAGAAGAAAIAAALLTGLVAPALRLRRASGRVRRPIAPADG